MSLITINKDRVYTTTVANSTSPYVVYKNNDLGVTCKNNGSYAKFPLSTMYSTGKYYLELKIDSVIGLNPHHIGIGIRPHTSIKGENAAYGSVNDIIIGQTHYFYTTKMTSLPISISISTGDVLGLAIDIDNKYITYYHNGTLKFSGNYTSSIVIPEVFVTVYNTSSSEKSFTFVVNKDLFTYPIPNGYIPYDGISNKYLIQDKNNVLKTVNNNIIIDSPLQILSADNFKTNGFDNLSLLNNKLNDIENPFKIYMYK